MIYVPDFLVKTFDDGLKHMPQSIMVFKSHYW